MAEFMARWFAGGEFMPYRYSDVWASELLWTNILSDIVIGVACCLIPAALIRVVRKRRDTRLHRAFRLFFLFIAACGATHLLSIWNIWHPNAWFDTLLEAAAAIATLTCALLLWPLIPKAMQIPANLQWQEVVHRLKREIAIRKNAEAALRESQALLRELAAYQERIREDERKRIAREIHDELGQNLLALRLDVAALHARAGGHHPQLCKRAGMALEYIDTTMKSIRTIMNNLRPAVLDLGLNAAIEWQVRQFESRNGVTCELHMADEEVKVSDAHATAVFRILQESLTNVGRHARATTVRIELRVDTKRLTLVVQDNGVGMNATDRRKVHRFGLIGIEERVNMLGGRMRLDSIPGRGTVLKLSIPTNVVQQEEAVAAPVA